MENKQENQWGRKPVERFQTASSFTPSLPGGRLQLGMCPLASWAGSAAVCGVVLLGTSPPCLLIDRLAHLPGIAQCGGRPVTHGTEVPTSRYVSCSAFHPGCWPGMWAKPPRDRRAVSAPRPIPGEHSGSLMPASLACPRTRNTRRQRCLPRARGPVVLRRARC